MYEMEGARSARLHHGFRLLVLPRALSDRPPALRHIPQAAGYPTAGERLRTSPERLSSDPEGPSRACPPLATNQVLLALQGATQELARHSSLIVSTGPVTHRSTHVFPGNQRVFHGFPTAASTADPPLSATVSGCPST